MSNLHEYIDKNGVRTRYVYVKREEDFLKAKKMYVMQDQTTRVMRKIEDAEDDVAWWNTVNILTGLAFVVVTTMMILAFWPLLPSSSIAGLFGWGGLIATPVSLFAFGFSVMERRIAAKNLRNYRRELEDLMIESM